MKIMGTVTKRSSLQKHAIFTPQKVLYRIDSWGQCDNTFYIRNLRFFVISLSVCPWQAFPA
jgi:hypothetical protein